MRIIIVLLMFFILSSCAQSTNSEIGAVESANPAPDGVPDTETAPIKTKKSAQSKSEFCESRKQSDYFKALANEPSNQLAFANTGGLKGKGVCWWHALFQRAVLYVTVYRPELPKPTKTDAKKIIHMIAAGGKIVEIPGYQNMTEFSHDWQPLIQEKLESWQKIDGFLKFAWIKGLIGSTHTEPQKIKSQWDEFARWIEVDHNIEWSMLQLEGISTHGVLFIGVKPGATYSIDYLDSNFVGAVSKFEYRTGDESVYSMYGPYVPYTGRRSDLKKFKKAADKYCDAKTADTGIEESEADYPLNNDLE